MKIFLMIGVILSVQNICFAADSNTQCESLDKTHKYHRDEITGGIWYPTMYQNYECIQEEVVTKLLSERLKMLMEFKILHAKWMVKKMLELEYKDLKFKLECNEVAILRNCSNALLHFVFDRNYDGDFIRANHIINVAIFLKNRLCGDSFNEHRAKLDKMIEAIQFFNEKEGQFFAIGKESFLYPNK